MVYNYDVFGDWLRPLMASRALTQDDLAAQIGVRQQTVSKWLRNLSVPHASNVLGLARALGVPEGEVLAQLRATPPLPEASGRAPREDEEELRQRVAALEEELRQQRGKGNGR